ncbi:MAG: N-acetyltransferase DgcN [Pseudomonadota bacterium]
MFDLKKPYLLFLGDAPDALAAKTARGIFDFRPDDCVGQLRLEGCSVSLDLPDMTLDQAYQAGARTLVIGVANAGGKISESWMSILTQALEAGYDLAAGLHSKLADIPALKTLADTEGRQLHDVRHPRGAIPIGTGAKRAGKRILGVGTDCSCGKMYTAVVMEAAMTKRGMKATLRATGQTGILVAGDGVSVDAVVADFISGAAEMISPANDEDHWDIVEGQGSLFHPSFAGVTTGLIHGSQPDALILCHEPTRTHMRGLPGHPIPDIADCMALNLKVAQLTNPDARFVGLSINTKALGEAKAKDYLAGLEDSYGLPATDPYRFGVEAIVDQLNA